MRCHNCGAELRQSAKFCDECGQRQGRPMETIFSEEEIAEVQQQSQPKEYLAKLKKIAEEGFEVEERGVAVLCVRLSGYLNLCSRLEREQLRDVMREVYSTTCEVIATREGYIDKLVDDEVTAIFGIPIGLERPCERVIAAVDEAQIGLAGVNHRFKDILPATLSVRAGVAFGKMLAGRLGDSMQLEYSALYQTINVAKRLADAALTGAVFVTKEVAARAEDAFDFQSVGELLVSEAEEPVDVMHLLGHRALSGESPRLSKLAAPMFGRDKELGKLKEAFGKLARFYPDPEPCKTGEGKYRGLSRIFGVTGEAGVGKSRLKHEFRLHLDKHFSESGFRWLVGGAWSVGETPLYWPIKAQIASELGFDPTASRGAIAGALSRLKDDMGDDADLVPYLYYLFGMDDPDSSLADLDPKTIRDNLWMAIRRLYARWSTEAPLVLVFEDMHWADGGTADFIDYLADFVSDFPILVLLLYRPGFEAKFATRKGVPFTEFGLEPLSSDAEADLLGFYMAAGERGLAFARRLRRHSKGNPLLVEESLQLLLEQGKLRLEEGKMRLIGDIEEMPLPADLPEVLGERFDRLPQEDKRVAYAGAVIGDSFATSLLSVVQTSLYGDSDLDRPLESLLDRELIFRKSPGPELEFIFKHDEMRDMMISRQATGLRREQSKLVAAGIEDSCKDNLDEFQGILAMHWEIAGEIDRAARSAASWGIYNAKRQRNLEAKAAFENYDRLSDRLGNTPLSSEEQAELLSSRIAVLEVLGRWKEAMALCDQLAWLENGAWRAKALNSKARVMWYAADIKGALEAANAALKLARDTGDRKEEANSMYNIGLNQSYDHALRSFAEARAIYRELNDESGLATVIAYTGRIYAIRGDNDEALRYYHEALPMHRELGDKRNAAKDLGNIGSICSDRGDYEEGMKCLDEALAMFRELGDKLGIAIGVLNIGVAHSGRGNCDSALRCFNETLAITRELGHKPVTAEAVGKIGLVHFDQGNYDDALRCYDEALAVYRELGNKEGIGSTLTNMAFVHAERGEWAKAEESAKEAEKIARSIDSPKRMSSVLSVLCRAEAGLERWDASLSAGTEAHSIADEVGLPERIVRSQFALGEAHLRMGRWYDGGKEGDPPPLSREEALAKATEHSTQARELAEERGMKGFVKKADELLAKIAQLRP
ncbi:MAG: tetratricopeptide repeat protein [Candidatus Coatesbacteria bacterium]|nr:tetratricopeptide repeat protein [Candidatus Coatesbacteria bacterium]